MGQLEKLYNLYLDAGLISSQVSLEMFANSNREQKAGLYDAGARVGLINQTSLAYVGFNIFGNLNNYLFGRLSNSIEYGNNI